MENVKPHHVVIISMIIFIVLTIIQGYLHYNLGRNSESIDKYKFNLPNIDECIHIGAIILIFGFIQGQLTVYFSNISDKN
jgi:uncharacterized membrane protein YidH (DUF202 family)